MSARRHPRLPPRNHCYMPLRVAPAPKGTLVLAGSGATEGKIPMLLSKRPEAKAFMAFRFGGFGLCAELHGEDMDGVLASATLDGLGVYEVSCGVRRQHWVQCVSLPFADVWTSPQNGAIMRKRVAARSIVQQCKPRPVPSKQQSEACRRNCSVGGAAPATVLPVGN